MRCRKHFKQHFFSFKKRAHIPDSHTPRFNYRRLSGQKYRVDRMTYRPYTETDSRINTYNNSGLSRLQTQIYTACQNAFLKQRKHRLTH
jgi:hypothetical protein